METDRSRQSVVFESEASVTVTEEPLPDPGTDEIRIETAVSAISPGTELLVYRGEAPAELTTAEPITAVNDTPEFPMQYGYAAVGRVVSVGDAVDESWRGERVFAFHPHESAFLATPDELHPVPDGIETDAAALLPNVETAVNLVMDARPMVGERVVVFGQGVVGLLTTALLAEHPVDTIVTVDRYESRRSRSRALGADVVLDADSGDVPSAVRQALGDERADVVIEVSGNPAALDDAIAATGEAGRIVVGSCYGTKAAELALGGYFHRSRIELKSSQVSTIDPEYSGRWSKSRRLDEAWRWLDTVDTDALVTDRLPVTQAATAYTRLDDHQDETLQVLLTYP